MLLRRSQLELFFFHCKGFEREKWGLPVFFLPRENGFPKKFSSWKKVLMASKKTRFFWIVPPITCECECRVWMCMNVNVNVNIQRKKHKKPGFPPSKKKLTSTWSLGWKKPRGIFSGFFVKNTFFVSFKKLFLVNLVLNCLLIKKRLFSLGKVFLHHNCGKFLNKWK